MNEHILRFNEASSFMNWSLWSKNHKTFPEYLDMYAKQNRLGIPFQRIHRHRIQYLETQRENKYITKILWNMYLTNPLINKLVKVELHEQIKADVIKLDEESK